MIIRGTGWLTLLFLNYTHEHRDGVAHTGTHDRHEGPLRVLQRLYPKARESATTCW